MKLKSVSVSYERKQGCEFLVRYKIYQEDRYITFFIFKNSHEKFNFSLHSSQNCSFINVTLLPNSLKGVEMLQATSNLPTLVRSVKELEKAVLAAHVFMVRL